MVGCSTNSNVTPFSGATTQQPMQSRAFSGPDWIYSGGVLYHRPHYMITAKMASSRVRQDITLSYGGGPVLVHPHIYITFWGYNTYGDPNSVKPLLSRYGRVLGGSPLNNVETQYYEKVGSKTINITNPLKQRLKLPWEDDVNPVPSQPTDAQVAAEAAKAVAHFGYDANGSYVVATPHGHSIAGFGTSFCAYHSSTIVNSKPVAYTNLPYMPDAGGSCGAGFISPPSDETSADEGVTIVEGHEYAESITDPVPFSGWNSGFGEIGDLCAWTNVQNDPFRTYSYSSQPEFSNASQSCVHHYP
jgi:hypothetical protein